MRYATSFLLAGGKKYTGVFEYGVRHLYIYEHRKVGSRGRVIVSCDLDGKDMRSLDQYAVIVKHLPIGHVPPLLFHEWEEVRRAAKERLTGEGP